MIDDGQGGPKYILEHRIRKFVMGQKFFSSFFRVGFESSLFCIVIALNIENSAINWSILSSSSIDKSRIFDAISWIISWVLRLLVIQDHRSFWKAYLISRSRIPLNIDWYVTKRDKGYAMDSPQGTLKRNFVVL